MYEGMRIIFSIKKQAGGSYFECWSVVLSEIIHFIKCMKEATVQKDLLTRKDIRFYPTWNFKWFWLVFFVVVIFGSHLYGIQDWLLPLYWGITPGGIRASFVVLTFKLMSAECRANALFPELSIKPLESSFLRNKGNMEIENHFFFCGEGVKRWHPCSEFTLGFGQYLKYHIGCHGLNPV